MNRKTAALLLALLLVAAGCSESPRASDRDTKVREGNRIPKGAGPAAHK
jgi:hypothetical protein